MSGELRLITADDAVAIFHIDLRLLAEWAKDGALPYGRTPGGQLLFHEVDVRALVINNRAAEANRQSTSPVLMHLASRPVCWCGHLHTLDQAIALNHLGDQTTAVPVTGIATRDDQYEVDAADLEGGQP